MRNTDKQRQSGCPVAFGLDTFGDRWSLLVIRELMFNGKSTYGEFLEMEEGISTNILADRLKHLEAEGILEKEQDPENRRSYRYRLTKKGRDLAPVMIEIIAWSGRHDKRPFALRAMVEKVARNRVQVEREARSVG
ncbi:winged helix-turn-helix transcriptional regulator [Aestuariispira insulae]|uniref:HxlR family transcriptional regulator n=1 Tax=Aestuariispira insulae TaxID=1461337 RepID=A0A3D9HSK3_9PROT|nr:helix-turn-helix domain-containing protein [Aestuariispira insulae]RED52488.1 HxlR family transcriptional regulator [Aestuariispira insulae]